MKHSKLPKSWSEITLESFVEISKIDKELGAPHYNSEIVSILLDEPIEEIEDLEIDELDEYIIMMKWATSQPSIRYQFELLGMTFKPLTTLTLFEYIDLDHYFTDNYIGNLPTICAILYRHSKVNEWGVSVVEPYDYDIQQRADLFLDLPITDVYGVINDFLKFRDKFLDNYRNLFGDADDELTDEERQALPIEEIKEIESENKGSKWSWERTIYNLTNGDITKSEAVGKLPLTYVFNILAMKQELDI